MCQRTYNPRAPSLITSSTVEDRCCVVQLFLEERYGGRDGGLAASRDAVEPKDALGGNSDPGLDASQNLRACIREAYRRTSRGVDLITCAIIGASESIQEILPPISGICILYAKSSAPRRSLYKSDAPRPRIEWSTRKLRHT